VFTGAWNTLSMFTALECSCWARVVKSCLVHSWAWPVYTRRAHKCSEQWTHCLCSRHVNAACKTMITKPNIANRRKHFTHKLQKVVHLQTANSHSPHNRQVWLKNGYLCSGRVTSSVYFPQKIAPLVRAVLDPHLIHGFLDPPEPTTQTASRSVQPFLYSSCQSAVGMQKLNQQHCSHLWKMRILLVAVIAVIVNSCIEKVVLYR